MIRQSDCKFFINKNKNTITCVYRPSFEVILDFFHIFDNVSKQLKDFNIKQENNWLREKEFVGIARCNSADEWNEETGKLVAFYKMKNKFFIAYFKHLNKTYNQFEDMLEDYKNTCNYIGNKFTNEINRLENLIKEKTGT